MRKNKAWCVGLCLLWAGSVWAQESVQPLPDLGVGTIGVDTGLSAAVWGDTPNVDAIMQQMKACAEADLNDAEREILERVLLTDVGGVAAFEAVGESFLQGRLDTLMRQGLFDAVVVLTDKIPVEQQSDPVRRTRAEALFALGRVTEACEAPVLAAFGIEEPFVRVACAAAVAEPPQAALAYDVYRENASDGHPFLNAAGDVLYRALSASLPDGLPSLWETPMVATAFGDDVFNLPLERAHLLVLAASERVPHEVRLRAIHSLKEPVRAEAKLSVLEALMQAAEARRVLERVVPVGEKP